MSQSIRQKSHFVEVTPTIDTSAYSVGDQLGDPVELKTGNDGQSGVHIISVGVLDKTKKDSEIDLLFFDEEPTTTSSDNDAIDISDAEMEKCVGTVKVEASDYVDLDKNSFATKNVDIGMRPGTGGSLWVLGVVQSANTYGAADDLTYKFYFQHDH